MLCGSYAVGYIMLCTKVCFFVYVKNTFQFHRGIPRRISGSAGKGKVSEICVC